MATPIERLRDDILAGATALGGNTIEIGNHFTNIIEGLQSFVGSYDQVILIRSAFDSYEFSWFFSSVVFVLKSEIM